MYLPGRNSMTATIQKWGNSPAVRIPRAVALQIHVADDDKVELKVNADSLVVRSARRLYRAQIFAVNQPPDLG